MTRRQPTVSICIPTFNRARMLADSIESVLCQTSEDFELIIVDNASKDDTEAVVRSFQDKRIVYSRNTRHLTLRDNWNRCLALPMGRYIAMLPDDDLMMPENIARKVEILSENSQVGLVHSKYDVLDEEGKVVKCNTNWGHGVERSVTMMESRRDVLSAPWNTINASSVIFRKACYDRLGGFAEELKFAFDWEYWMRISVYYDVVFLAESLIKWRIHSGTITLQHLATDKFQMLREHLIAKHLITKYHLPCRPGWRQLKKYIWQRMGERVVFQIEGMLEESGPNQEMMKLVLDICRQCPEIYLQKNIWKVFLKSVLSRQSIDTLKRLYSVEKLRKCFF